MYEEPQWTVIMNYGFSPYTPVLFLLRGAARAAARAHRTQRQQQAAPAGAIQGLPQFLDFFCPVIKPACVAV